ncbi:MAG: hypothetical protein ACYTDX_00500 [Planctomycetota bacterium]|jgi:hypothetical protein
MALETRSQSRSVSGTVAAPRGDAKEALRARIPDLARAAEEVRELKGNAGAMSRILQFRSGGERYVLKVFQEPRDRPVLRRLHRGLSRFTRAHIVDDSIQARVVSERARTEAFRAAGFGTFDLLDAAWPDALLYRFHEGMELRFWMNHHGDDGQRMATVVHLAEDLRRRQALGLERGDFLLIHPFPRMQHVFRERGGRWLYFDFEGTINPALTIEEALGGEVEDFFFNLLRVSWAKGDRFVRAAWDAVGEDAIARWGGLRRPALAVVHSSVRKRRGLLESLRRRLAI